MLCVGSSLCVITYSILDKYAEGRIRNPVAIDPNANALNFRVKHQLFRILIFRLSSNSTSASGSFPSCAWRIILVCFLSLPFAPIFWWANTTTTMTLLEKLPGTTAPSFLILLASIITLSSLVLSPILGGMLDWVGRRPYFGNQNLTSTIDRNSCCWKSRDDSCSCPVGLHLYQPHFPNCGHWIELFVGPKCPVAFDSHHHQRI